MTPSRGRRAVLLLLLFVAYVAAGKLGLSLAFVNASASAVWPPTGIALAACLLAGRWVWPAIFAGAFVVNITTSPAVVPSILIACGNTLEGVGGAWLVQRSARGVSAFDTAPRLLRYAAAVMLAAALAATIGVGALIAGGLAPMAAAPSIWLTWWLGDFSGGVLVAPAIICWIRARDFPSLRRHWLEGTLLAFALTLSCYLVFGASAPGIRRYPLMFVVLPVLLWVSLRFGGREVTAALLFVSLLATLGTLNGYGPFGQWSPVESLLLLQGYLSVTAVVMLSLAAEFRRRHTIEEEMRLLNVALADQVRIKDEFLATLSHELRTPLNAVLGWSQMLRDTSLPEPLRIKALDAIHRNVAVQGQLVSDILDVSRMSSHTLRIERHPVRLAAVVEDAAETVGPLIASKNLTLSIAVPADVVVHADAPRLQQVLWNLLANAAKFTPQDGAVGLIAARSGRSVEIVVSDSGPGIDAAFLPFVFDPFRQADQTTTRAHGGLGLGLAITRELVALHEGTIVAANQEGGGAVFTVTLPLAQEPLSGTP
jgi:signal transduction histidine kinase